MPTDLTEGGEWYETFGETALARGRTARQQEMWLRVKEPVGVIVSSALRRLSFM